jgi:hypothetical protein
MSYNSTSNAQLKLYFDPPPFPSTVGICINFTNISCRATCQLQLWLKNLSLNRHGWRDTKLQWRVPQYRVLQSNCKPTETVFLSPLIFPNYVLKLSSCLLSYTELRYCRG